MILAMYNIKIMKEVTYMYNRFFPLYNFVLLFGIGFYLMIYCFMAEVEAKTGLPAISGTLMGYALFSTYMFVKAKRLNNNAQNNLL